MEEGRNHVFYHLVARAKGIVGMEGFNRESI